MPMKQPFWGVGGLNLKYEYLLITNAALREQEAQKLISMKRLFILLVTAIACGAGVMAQENWIATLQHGSDIQAFYGENALSAAHEAAVDGDIITLSAGEFYGLNVTKAITLRGESMERTLIKSRITFTLPEKSTHTLVLEGLKITYSWDDCVNIYGSDGTEKAIVSKCYIHVDGRNWALAFENCKGTVIQSHVNGSIGAYTGSHVTCLNSIIRFLVCEGNGTFDVENCFLSDELCEQIHYSTIKNSIFQNGFHELRTDNTNTFSHCLVAGTIPIPVSDFGWTLTDVWNPWDGIVGENYHLTEEAAATYIGTDGTQIGIYGGMYPYDLAPSYPLVKTLDVVGSHKNGKLNVKINVK